MEFNCSSFVVKKEDKKEIEDFFEFSNKVSEPDWVPFHKIDYANEIINSFIANKFTLILKCRRAFVSTIAMQFAMFKLLNNRNLKIKFISPGHRSVVCNQEECLNIGFKLLDKPMNYSKNFHKSLIKFNSDDVGHINFYHAIEYVPYDLDYMIVDEASFVKNIHKIMPYLSITTNCKLIIISSPSMLEEGEWFKGLYKGATLGDNFFNPIKIDYKRLPYIVQKEKFNEAHFEESYELLSW